MVVMFSSRIMFSLKNVGMGSGLMSVNRLR